MKVYADGIDNICLGAALHHVNERLLEAREDIKITDVAPIIRSVEGVCGEGDMVQRRWSWPGQNKRGREVTSNRCLIVADGGGTKISSGQRRLAVTDGIADRTPKARAS